jgi:hypothetical protein
MRRIRNTETKVVAGVEFTIHSMENMSYTGEWEFEGFDVEYNGKSTRFFGYPISDDLEALLRFDNQN